MARERTKFELDINRIGEKIKRTRRIAKSRKVNKESNRAANGAV